MICGKCKIDKPSTRMMVIKGKLVTKCLDCWDKQKKKKNSPAIIGYQGGGSYKSKI